MRNLLLASFMVLGLSVSAQDKNAKQIQLSKGQNIQVVHTNSSDIDMGMGMQMKNNIVMNNIITVNGENEKEFSLTSTLKHAKGSMELMGQTKEFDTDVKSDDEMSKTFSEAVGKPQAITVNKFSGASTLVKDEKDKTADASANPMDEMMKSFGNSGEDITVNSAFFIIPAGKKMGDSWVEKDSTKEAKTSKTYTINSISNNNAVISFKSVTDMSNTFEVQGNSMDVSMNTKSSGEILSDIKTGLVSKKITDSEIAGTINMMGQSMPISGKTNITSVFTIAK